jgi:mono/diheme cytochrome c family protein
MNEPGGKPVDASKIPGFVLPQTPADTGYFDYANNNIQLGQAGIILYNNAMTGAIFSDERGCASGICKMVDQGDDGYGTDIGEMTWAACTALGQSALTCDPNTGGIDSGVTYIVFTTSTNAVSSSSQPTASSVASVSANALNVIMPQLGSPQPTNNPQPTPQPTLSGQQLYYQDCSACHGGIATSTKLGATAAQITTALSTVSAMNQISLTGTQIQAIADALGGVSATPTPTPTPAPCPATAGLVCIVSTPTPLPHPTATLPPITPPPADNSGKIIAIAVLGGGVIFGFILLGGGRGGRPFS